MPITMNFTIASLHFGCFGRESQFKIADMSDFVSNSHANTSICGVFTQPTCAKRSKDR